MKPCFYFFNGSFAYLGKSTDTDFHSHHALQISISLDNPFQLETMDLSEKYRAVIIDTDINHKLDGLNEWHLIFLIDPEHVLVRKIKKNGLKNITELKYKLLRPYTKKIVQSMTEERACVEVRKNTYELLSFLSGVATETNETDPRILKIFDFVKNLEEKKVSIEILMNLVNLSESRLSHLFKEQTGIPVRRYILWIRLTGTFKSVIEGKSLTEAAHIAGFSDSAHFTRTFKSMFGVTPSTYLKKTEDSRFIQLKYC
ncbi:MAG: AraC family transcriptional regulator [Desulfobacterales bacterium]|nr:AraC family transcriptional regulator [Desulfobacterales bacterium]MCP4158485.1 AraC family transcriptional regulator [Deltaproteobacteria bacterium]